MGEDESEFRRKERAKYTKWYFENMYWVEDFPGKQHYRAFAYDDPTHEKRFRYLTDVLIKHFQFSSALDAGCGMGHVVRNLLAAGYDAKGIDISEDAIREYMPDLAEEGIVQFAGMEKLPFEDNQFDLVFSSDVMEHIPLFDIEASIAELIRVCKKHLVLTINLDHPYEYHPSILPSEEWVERFLSSGKLKDRQQKEQGIERETKKKYDEYDWFVFEKI